MKGILVFCVAALALCATATSGLAAERRPAPPGAEARIIWPSDGARLHGGKFWLRMGLSGAGIAPAGVDHPNTGHHHLIIDADLPPMDEPIPNDKNHLHFGKGQTEVLIELPPGKHTLQLLLGDADHLPPQSADHFQKNHCDHAAMTQSSTRKTASSFRWIAVAATVFLLTPAAASTAQETHDHGAPTPSSGPRGRTHAPPNAYCYIGWPNDGEVIHRRHIKVWFGTRNFGIAPAGVDTPNTGHHHLLIDVDLPPMDEPIPNDKNHLHFGNGQTETYIDLPPGKHTLQLLMGDADHVPHDPPVMSKRITIYVK